MPQATEKTNSRQDVNKKLLNRLKVATTVSDLAAIIKKLIKGDDNG